MFFLVASCTDRTRFAALKPVNFGIRFRFTLQFPHFPAVGPGVEFSPSLILAFLFYKMKLMESFLRLS